MTKKRTTHDIGTVLDDIYDAWRAQNLDWLATYLPHDFSHRINIPPALHPLGGERQGKPAALERLGLIFAQFETKRFNTGQLTIDDRKATLEVNTLCVHRSTGVSLDIKKQHIWTIEDGWPARLEEYYDVGPVTAFLRSVAPSASAGFPTQAAPD